MKKLSTINFDVSERGVAKITLSRPEKHNAMNRQMIDELKDVASQITASDNNSRATVSTSFNIEITPVNDPPLVEPVSVHPWWPGF